MIKTKDRECCESRFGIIVPRCVGSAVVRNRARRIVSEWIRNNLREFPEGMDYLVIISNFADEKKVLASLENIVEKGIADEEKA